MSSTTGGGAAELDQLREEFDRWVFTVDEQGMISAVHPSEDPHPPATWAWDVETLRRKLAAFEAHFTTGDLP